MILLRTLAHYNAKTISITTAHTAIKQIKPLLSLIAKHCLENLQF